MEEGRKAMKYFWEFTAPVTVGIAFLVWLCATMPCCF